MNSNMIDDFSRSLKEVEESKNLVFLFLRHIFADKLEQKNDVMEVCNYS